MGLAKGGNTVEQDELLAMKNIHKSFPGVYALKGANLTLHKGEVHALVGENGAGKSTLMNVLGGIYRKDNGEIYIKGQKCDIRSVSDATQNGISIIHQEIVLVPHLTVAENIFLNREPKKGKLINYSEMYQQSIAFAQKIGIDMKVDQEVATLTIAQQQMVEIVKAVSFGADIIVMDEPTSSLSDNEVDALFRIIRTLKTRGAGIIYISHKMSELSRIADTVTVMRDGETVRTMKVNETSNDEIVRLMVGREMHNYYMRTYNQPGETVLQVNHLCSGSVHDVSFEVRSGEIVGFAGLVGAGRTETFQALLGLDAMISGEVRVGGQKVTIHNPAQAYKLGIGYIPESRRDEGIFPTMSTRFNASLKVLQKFIHGIRVDSKKEEKIVKRYCGEMDVKTPSLETMIQNLSGGNQQKVVIASWLATDPKILIMDEPTRGIDVGAKAEIYAIINELAKRGMAIVMISSELPEIINMSDRVVVMRTGTVSGILSRDEATQEKIMQYAVNI